MSEYDKFCGYNETKNREILTVNHCIDTNNSLDIKYVSY